MNIHVSGKPGAWRIHISPAGDEPYAYSTDSELSATELRQEITDWYAGVDSVTIAEDEPHRTIETHT